MYRSHKFCFKIKKVAIDQNLDKKSIDTWLI